MALNLVERSDDRVAVRRVLVSVSNKTGLDALVEGLLKAAPGVTIYSTGGTHSAIRTLLGEERARKSLVSVSDYTGQPEMQGGLVKTLDFKIYLGLLSETYNDAHRRDLERAGAVPFDMVVVNLYPFRETVGMPDVTPEKARTNVDIGGPCMIRAAAKNFLRVAAVTDTSDYAVVVSELEANGGTLGLRTRFHLAQKAFGHTAAYDLAIVAYFENVPPEEVERCYRR
jgi:phosphoribosylaminoimidazolecarboxamide formyltransferase/IMP cyclohydrolase